MAKRPRARGNKRQPAPARPPGWALPLFLAAVFLVKLIVMLQLRDHPLLQPAGSLDSAAYANLAQRVLGGDVGLGPGLYYVSPLYIYFLAATLGLGGSFTFVRVVQIALGTGAVWFVFLTARSWFGARAGWIAAALAALTGAFTFYEILILPSALDTVLTAAALYALTRGLIGGSKDPPYGGLIGGLEDRPCGEPIGGSEDPPYDETKSAGRRASVVGRASVAGRASVVDRPSVVGRASVAGRASVVDRPSVVGRVFRPGVAAGMLFGLQILNRPNVAIAVAGVALTLLAVRRWRTALLLTGGVALALAPVVIRNVVVSHQFALVSSQGGLNFFVGNNASATGQYNAVAGVRANIEGQSEDTRRVAEQAVGRPLTDAEVSSYFTRQATSWMRDHPAAAARLFARKLALVFNHQHQWLDFSYPYYAHDTGSILWSLFCGPWLLVPLGLAGIVIGARQSKFWVWWSFVPLYAISVALFFVAERYRLPLFVPLCVTAGVAVEQFLYGLGVLRAPNLQPPTSILRVGLPLLVAGATLTMWPFHLNDGRYDERLRLAKALMNDGDFGRAVTELQGAHRIDPSNSIAEFNLGIALMNDGRGTEGVAHIRHAVDAGVPIEGARYALAGALLTVDRAEAAKLLRTFSPAPDDSADSCYRVAMLALNADVPVVARRYLERALVLRPGWSPAEQLLQRISR